MTLTLRLENFDLLENGGPVWITLKGHGASAGRNKSMNWVLPDATRHVSGHHFDISFHSGCYWLTDVSTNGTFLQGQPHRLQGPLQLRGGERLIVGHYVIAVEADATPVAKSQSDQEADPWDLGVLTGTPVNPLPQRAAASRAFDDAAQQFLQLTPSAPGPAPAPQAAEGQVTAPNDYSAVAPVPMPSPASPAPAPPPAATPPLPRPVPIGTAPATPPATPSTDILRAFCEGAGLDPSLAQGSDPEQLARSIGQALRGSAEEVMRMLQDRASVKQFTKGGERTMRHAHGNNPLKFLPNTNEALDAMFLNPREGFMEGSESFAKALADLRSHQQAVFAALQPALAAVLQGLSPEEIEAVAGSSPLLGGSRRGKLWESYVARWDEKAAEAEHGMLDVFLKAFAQAYHNAAQQNGNFD